MASFSSISSAPISSCNKASSSCFKDLGWALALGDLSHGEVGRGEEVVEEGRQLHLRNQHVRHRRCWETSGLGGDEERGCDGARAQRLSGTALILASMAAEHVRRHRRREISGLGDGGERGCDEARAQRRSGTTLLLASSVEQRHGLGPRLRGGAAHGLAHGRRRE